MFNLVSLNILLISMLEKHALFEFTSLLVLREFDEKDLGSSSWWQVSGELMNKGESACASLKGNFVCLIYPCVKKVEVSLLGRAGVRCECSSCFLLQKKKKAKKPPLRLIRDKIVLSTLENVLILPQTS